MRKTITFIELIIVLSVIVIIVKVLDYKKPPIPTIGDMVLIKSCPTGDFYIGKYEVTNKEYCQYEPNHKNPGDNLPVVEVSWNDAVGYCTWLSNKSGKHYRLPAEAEWEYACRAGSTTDYYWGNNIDLSYCWSKDNSGGQVHPVGQKKPNAFGLYDMAGNVWEWCSDHVIRGGSWDTLINDCRSSFRCIEAPGSRYYNDGFRIVMTP